ncbi:MAG: MATE family efflux transporter [Bordetella sp.]|nr:MAG: MATE family efflux transporter [Bordetella sp.]
MSKNLYNQSSWKREILATIFLSFPLILTSLAQMAMTITDVIFIGKLGSQALAAASLGANLYTIFAFFGLGLVTTTAPMMARVLGERKRSLKEIRSIVQQGLWTSLIISIPTCFVLWNGEKLLLAIHQQNELAKMAGHYLRAMMWAMPTFLGYLVLRSFMAALQRPRWAFIVTVIGILVNIFGNWILVFGYLGFPALGLVGSGLATTLASLFLFLGMVVVILIDKQFRRYYVFGNILKINRDRLISLWKLGMPIAITTTFEATIFNSAAFLMGWLGENELAAHTIAIQITSAAFMIPYGIAQAATIRVGYAYGSGNLASINKSGWSAFLLSSTFMIFSATFMLLKPESLISVFIDIKNLDNIDVLYLAIHYLFFSAVFQTIDGLQVVGAGILRGLHDTRIPMLYAAFGYWVIGLPTSAILALYTNFRGTGIWIGLVIGVNIVSILMIRRWILRESLNLIRY